MDKYQKLISKGEEAIKNRNFLEASKLYEEAFKYKIILKDYLMLCSIYYEIDEFNKAEEMFNILLDYMKDNDYKDFDEIYYGLGTIYRRTNRNQEAIETFEKIKNKKNHIDGTFSLAVLYEEKATDNEEDFNGENVQKAINYYKIILEVEPKNFGAYLNLGCLYERCDQDQEALECFLKAYEYNIDSDNEYHVSYNLAVGYGKLKDKENALKYYLEEISKKNFYELTYYNLAILYKDEYKDYEKSKYYYLKALELNQEDYYSWYNLGCLYAIMNDFKNANDCFKYLYYKNHDFIAYMKLDDELEEFRKTPYYEELLK